MWTEAFSLCLLLLACTTLARLDKNTRRASLAVMVMHEEYAARTFLWQLFVLLLSVNTLRTKYEGTNLQKVQAYRRYLFYRLYSKAALARRPCQSLSTAFPSNTTGCRAERRVSQQASYSIWHRLITRNKGHWCLWLGPRRRIHYQSRLSGHERFYYP